MSNELDLEEKLQKLFEKYQQLILFVPKEDKKYFRLKTLHNIIFHFKNIKDINDREWVYKGVADYFEASMELINSINREDSVQLYRTYLRKIIDYYDRVFGFTYYSAGPVFFLYVSLTIILSLFLAPYFSILISVILCLLHHYYFYQKYKTHKLYGVFY